MGTVVALAGQVGGAKLVDGLYRLRGKDLAAIINTGDVLDVFFLGMPIIPADACLAFMVGDSTTATGIWNGSLVIGSG